MALKTRKKKTRQKQQERHRINGDSEEEKVEDETEHQNPKQSRFNSFVRKVLKMSCTSTSGNDDKEERGQAGRRPRRNSRLPLVIPIISISEPTPSPSPERLRRQSMEAGDDIVSVSSSDSSIEDADAEPEPKIEAEQDGASSSDRPESSASSASFSSSSQGASPAAAGTSRPTAPARGKRKNSVSFCIIQETGDANSFELEASIREDHDNEAEEDHIVDDDDDIDDDLKSINPFKEDSADAETGSFHNLDEPATGSRLDQVRKMSDQTFRRFLGRFRPTSSMSERSATPERPAEDPRQANDFQARAARKMSVDSSGILKRRPSEPGRIRKSVSFCEQDSVRIFDVSLEDEEDVVEAGAEAEADQEDNDPSLPKHHKSLVPTFVPAGRRPNYADEFKASVFLLESLSVTEDFCVLGNIRINVPKLKARLAVDNGVRIGGGAGSGKRKIVVGVHYTTDDWSTRQESLAMVVKHFVHPGLDSDPVYGDAGGDGAVNSRCLRFAIDCGHFEVGQNLQFSLWCRERPDLMGAAARVAGSNNIYHSRAGGLRLEDDNSKQFYKVCCTRRLNQWAEQAARELRSFAPVVKFNNYYRP